MRAKVVFSDMDGMKIDLKDMLERVTDSTKLLVVCNPNNPTGHALQKEDVHAFIEKAPPDVLVIMDEAYMEFADSERFPGTLSILRSGKDNLVILRTLSKAYGLAGFRVGYGIAEANIIEVLDRIKLPFNLSVPSQFAAAGALRDEEFLRKTVDMTKAERGYINAGLKAMGFSYVESSTNFVLIDVKRDGDLVAGALEERGVIVRSAKNYGAPTCIRVTIGTREQNIRFLGALRETLL